MSKQPQDYHQFADARVLFGIENAADTLSNLAFLAVGIMGLAFLWRERAAGASRRFASPREMTPYFLFFAGVAATSAGSAYYHLAPDDARLAWDRLPMAVAFMSLLAAVIVERVNVRAGLRLLWPLVILGAASVVYWRVSATAGAEDLRPYGVVQFGSIAAILAIAALFRSRYTHAGAIFWVAGAYAMAKLFEALDREIYALGHLVSGHTLKHLAAALGVYLLLRSLKRRQFREKMGSDQVFPENRV
ncbi:MAG TPA: hypothetical protein VML57_13180 [Burkholderiales bacterium]|nr:hypothetical protein [Burkholderiales bacterium]